MCRKLFNIEVLFFKLNTSVAIASNGIVQWMWRSSTQMESRTKYLSASLWEVHTSARLFTYKKRLAKEVVDSED